MKVIKPSYEIWQCPEGEACLSLLERIGRIAYKSEDKIDQGSRGLCPHCNGQGKGHGPEYDCPHCGPNGTVLLREPSSHKFIRMILRADRREQLIKKATAVLWGMRFDADSEVAAQRVVDLVLDEVRDNPAHLGILEHVLVTVLFVSNRGFTHELVRHRVASYVQSSTRYCNYSKDKFGNEITVIERKAEDICDDLDSWMDSLRAGEKAYLDMVNKGARPEFARDVLSQATMAEIAATANLSEWRHIFRLRCSPRAHPDMRGLMIPLRDELRRRIPIVFDEL